MAKANKEIVVEQIGSVIGATKDQRATVIGLGLKKMHSQRKLQDTPAVRGMVEKIPHLVKIVEEK